MSEKKVILFDHNNDESQYGFSANDTLVEVRDHATGALLFREKNKVIMPGSEFSALGHFDLEDAGRVYPCYNDIIGTIDAMTEAQKAATQWLTKEKIFLFCIGTDGCGPENSQKYAVDYTKIMLPAGVEGYDPAIGGMIPFKFVYANTNNDLSIADRSVYFGKTSVKLNATDSYFAYYFKTFSSTPKLHRIYDGAELEPGATTGENAIYNRPKTDAASCYVELRLTINESDFRDYFSHTVGLNSAKWNSLSLCTGRKCMVIDNSIGGVQVPSFQDIRPITKLHVGNNDLSDTSMAYDIIYQLYY